MNFLCFNIYNNYTIDKDIIYKKLKNSTYILLYYFKFYDKIYNLTKRFISVLFFILISLPLVNIIYIFLLICFIQNKL